MKSKTVVVSALLLCSLLTSPVLAQHTFSLGGRYHGRQTEFEELPLSRGDLSYTVGYEYYDAAGFWQLLLSYTPSVSSGSDGRGDGVESVLTPQLNLLLEDRGWLAGAGIMASYVRTETENDWTSLYWQTMIGYQLKLQLFDVELMVYYPFEKWEVFTDFETENLEYGISLKRKF